MFGGQHREMERKRAELQNGREQMNNDDQLTNASALLEMYAPKKPKNPPKNGLQRPTSLEML